MPITQQIEWGMVSKPFPGEKESGDQCLVQPFSDGVLVAVIDGLGHGLKASKASTAAVDALRDHADKPVDYLFEHVHRALRSTRGAVMSLASFNETSQSMSWVGIGNVSGVFLRANITYQTLMLRGGVVGYRLPKLNSFSIPLQPQDTVVFATDGLRTNFTTEINLSNPPQQLADDIFKTHYRGTDDALVLVAKYRGSI